MDSAVRSPFGSCYFGLYAVVATASAFIAVYRGVLYLLPAGAWALSLAVASLALAAPLLLARSVRGTLLIGKVPVALAVPFVGLALSPRLVPSALTIAPFLFCAGALAGTCAVAWVNVRHRRRRLRRALDVGDAEEFVKRYFAAGTSADAAADWRGLRHALRAQAWRSTPERRARAADRLRQVASAIARQERVPIPADLPVLAQLAEPCAATVARTRSALLDTAHELDNGGRIVRWRWWLWSLFASGLDGERDWVAAVDLLARRHRVSRPRWFRSYRTALSRAPLTARDILPLRTFRPALARQVTAVIVVLVFASVLLSTATAQTPVDDARALPVMTGPRVESHIEPRLSAVLSTLTGHRAEARCWSWADWRRLSKQRSSWPRHDRPLGRWSAYAAPAHDEAHFSPTLCAVLSRVAYGLTPVWDDDWPNALAFAVGTLAHEAQHLRGTFNEAKAECYGMQAIAQTAELLGRTPLEGGFLAELYWRDDYHDEDRDPAYFSGECRNGGRLDLNPTRTAWP